MDIRDAIVSAGVKAVRTHREIAGNRQDNEVPERFLSSVMAIYLHDSLHVNTKVEHDYALIARDLGMSVPPDDLAKVSALRADIVIYRSSVPLAVIEIKKFVEGNSAASIALDLHKGDPINLSGSVQAYGGVLVCETTSQYLDARKAILERAVGHDILYSDPIPCNDWHWCFGCGYIDRMRAA